jgi:hypothetical protein
MQIPPKIIFIFEKQKIECNRKQIIEYYMVMGGVPFYLEFIKKSKSVAQNIDSMFFAENAPFKDEFSLSAALSGFITIIDNNRKIVFIS